MAIFWAKSTGNWTTRTNWLTAAGQDAGRLPGIEDEVYPAGFTVTIDTNVEVYIFRNGAPPAGSTGGTFSIANGSTVKAFQVRAGANVGTVLTFSQARPATCNVIADIYGAFASGSYGLRNSSTGTVFVTGNSFTDGGGNGQNPGIYNDGGGELYLFGNAFGGSQQVNQGAVGFTNLSPSTAYIIGNVFGGSVGGTQTIAPWGVNNTGILILSGNCVGGNTFWNAGIRNTTGRVTIYGVVSGGPNMFKPDGVGIFNEGVGTIIVYGNVYGGFGSSAYGIYNFSTGKVFIYGDCKGGYGVNCHGAFNNVRNGEIYVTKAVGNGWGLQSQGSTLDTAYGSSVGLFNNTISGCVVESIECGIRGNFPTGGIITIKETPKTKGVLTTGRDQVTLFTSTGNVGLPVISNVRRSTLYNYGALTGTLAMPFPSQVNFSVPIDNSSGTAVFISDTVWQAPISGLNIKPRTMGQLIRRVCTNITLDDLIKRMS